MKIAHISDIHFFRPSFKLSHLFTNEWLGTLNALVNRKDYFITSHLNHFLASLLKEKVDVLVISGDMTTTSNHKEFILAKAFIQSILDAHIKVFAIAGNHDAYTKKAIKGRSFYTLLDNLPRLSQENIHFESLTDFWGLILLDTTMYNTLGRANGNFTLAHEQKLKALLKRSSNLIIANHFPLKDKSQKHQLIRDQALYDLLKSSSKKILYLHGHTHETTYTKESEKFHIFNSSESTVAQKFQYHVIDLSKDDFSYKVVKYHGQ